MQFASLPKSDSSLKTLVVLTTLLFAAMVSTVGCSKVEKKPEKKPQVVTEMNIQAPSDESKATNSSEVDSKKDEVESLPFDEGQDKEEELPILGDGG